MPKGKLDRSRGLVCSSSSCCGGRAERKVKEDAGEALFLIGRQTAQTGFQSRQTSSWEE